MKRTDRLFQILQLLRDGELHRASDLAQQLDVSVRTIWRDMKTLAASGLPIEGERGLGYILGAPITLPPVALGKEELEALRLGITLVSSAQDPATARAAKSLAAKIAAVAPFGTEETGSESFVFSTPEAARAAPYLGLLRRALRDRLILTLHYRDEAGTESERRIRPLHLEYWGHAWILTAWCELSQDFRVFRVDLVTSLQPDGTAFLPEPGKTAEDYLARLVRA